MTELYGKYNSLYAASRAALEAAADLIEPPGKGFDGFSVDGLVSFNAADAGGRLCEPTDPAATTWSPRGAITKCAAEAARYWLVAEMAINAALMASQAVRPGGGCRAETRSELLRLAVGFLPTAIGVHNRRYMRDIPAETPECVNAGLARRTRDEARRLAPGVYEAALLVLRDLGGPWDHDASESGSIYYHSGRWPVRISNHHLTQVRRGTIQIYSGLGEIPTGMVSVEEGKRLLARS